MRHFIFQHIDLESGISSYFEEEARNLESAKKKANKTISSFTPGTIESVQEATAEEVAVLSKFGVLCD